MFTDQNTLTISELRKNTLEVLERAEELNEPLTIFSNSKPVGVFMSMKVYKLMKESEQTESEKALEAKAWDFLLNPPKDVLIKNKGVSAVDLIRKERD